MNVAVVGVEIDNLCGSCLAENFGCNERCIENGVDGPLVILGFASRGSCEEFSIMKTRGEACTDERRAVETKRIQRGALRIDTRRPTL